MFGNGDIGVWVWELGLDNCMDFPIQIDNFKYEMVLIEMTL